MAYNMLKERQEIRPKSALLKGIKFMLDIRKFNYGNYSSDNYGAHSLAFETPQGVYYFSYNTLIAFKSNKTYKLYVKQNIWGNTTGKHLNWIDGGSKSTRLTEAQFENALKEEGVL